MSENQSSLPVDGWLDLLEAAKVMRAHPSTIYRWVQSGALPAAKRVGRLFVRRADLLALMQPIKLPTKSPPEPTKSQNQAWANKVLRDAGFDL